MPILQIIQAQYKTFGDITDAELIAEALYPRAKLSAAELKIMLRRVYALYYDKWLTANDVVFCVQFVKVGDM
jgi:hypothetical protein